MTTGSGTDSTSRILGGVTIAGCAIAVVADFATAALSGRFNAMENTISNLAAGRYDWLADGGLYAFVIAVLAATAGLRRWRIERLDWRIGTIALILLAGAVALIAGYEAYSTGDGTVIHYRLVYAIGVLFPAAALLTAGQFYTMNKPVGIALYALGGLFLVMGPGLFVVPTGIDGGFERVLAALMLLWFLAAGIYIWRDPDVADRVDDDQQG